MPLLHKKEHIEIREKVFGMMITTDAWVNYCNGLKQSNQVWAWAEVTCPVCLNERGTKWTDPL